MTKKMGPPRKIRSLFDIAVGARDLAVSFAFSPFISHRLPEGNGKPVLVMPGFTAGDMTTAPLRHFLKAQGYNAKGWGLGLNLGPSETRLEGIEARLDKIYEAYGKEPVHIVGWSLGGFYAREMARRFPEKVANVVSLGTPYHATKYVDSTIVGGIFSLLNPDYQRHLEERMGGGLFETVMHPVQSPTTSIYTRNDGVANWRSCILPEGPNTENVEVRATSHLGIGFNLQVAVVLADRLAQSKESWKPFNPDDYPFAWIAKSDDHVHRKSRNWEFGHSGPVPLRGAA